MAFQVHVEFFTHLKQWRAQREEPCPCFYTVLSLLLLLLAPLKFFQVLPWTLSYARHVLTLPF